VFQLEVGQVTLVRDGYKAMALTGKKNWLVSGADRVGGGCRR